MSTRTQTQRLDALRLQATQELGGLEEQVRTIRAAMLVQLDPSYPTPARREHGRRALEWIRAAHETLHELHNARDLAELADASGEAT